MKKMSTFTDAAATPTKELYGYFEAAYDHFNQTLFGGILPPCLVTVQRKTKTMGYASHKRWSNFGPRLVDELAINPDYWLGYPELEVLQTLLHEQCHIWQSHFGKPSRRSYHNREWAEKMESFGLVPSSTGAPGGRKTGEKIADYALAGGAFFKACEELATQKHRLPWFDCRAPFTGVSSSRLYSVSGAIVSRDELNDIQRSLLQPLGDGRQRASSKNVVYLHQGAGAASLGLASPSGPVSEVSACEEGVLEEGGETAVLIEQYFQPAAKKPTRVKYVCGDCSNQLWGKPNMNVLCGDCDIAFTQDGG